MFLHEPRTLTLPQCSTRTAPPHDAADLTGSGLDATALYQDVVRTASPSGDYRVLGSAMGRSLAAMGEDSSVEPLR